MNDLINKTFNNIVMPAGAKIEVLSGRTINLNTYNGLTPLFKALIISTNNGGKYALNVMDEKMGFYFNYSEGDLSIKVPLTALFNTNDKLKGILGIKWASAIECPSRQRDLCQLDDPADCYAYNGERQGSKKSANYLMGMGSYLNSLLCIYYFNLFNKSPEIRETFKRYCNYYNINTLRFNLSGDFKNHDDLINLKYLADMDLKLTGYTARDDLREDIMPILNKYDNIILNGSNKMYTNQFKAVDNIEYYFKAQYSCRGGCLKNGCLNCYKLHGKVIIVLIHGSRAGITLNTDYNRRFIVDIMNTAGYQISEADLNKYADLFRAVNNYFKKNDLYGEVPSIFKKLNKNGEPVFDGHNGFINYLKSLYNKGGL